MELSCSFMKLVLLVSPERGQEIYLTCISGVWYRTWHIVGPLYTFVGRMNEWMNVFQRTMDLGLNLCLPFCYCSVVKLCLTLWNPMNCNMPDFPVLQYLLEFAQIHVLWVSDAISLSHSLPPSSFALNLSQDQGLFQWISCSHQITEILEFQLQHQSFQWLFRIDFL